MSRTPGSSASTSGEQLKLQIPETGQDSGAIEIAENLREPGYRGLKKSSAVPLILTLCAMAVLIFTVNLPYESLPGTKKPELLRSAYADQSVPEIRHFPPIDLPAEGQLIQVGIFTKLSGAERKQIALTRLGLDPYVQKRMTENGLQYAVLLGPLSASTHDKAVTTLTRNNYSYFHRPNRGS